MSKRSNRAIKRATADRRAALRHRERVIKAHMAYLDRVWPNGYLNDNDA